ncbi:beta-galactosidase [Neobacillus dielmonensis]|uniref:beta-galactosidase n=1 Tax=Neobacillus dielmonensis TaxID=1347369 RepID=UPI0005A82A62|nr:beta-galactosidase [Neobacillus dielmonensis]
MEYSKVNNLLHGGDYNPEQWLDRPDILKEDIRLMRLANVNVVTLGVFSWSSLEPKEGVFTFQWLDDIMDWLYENEIYTILSTPSGGKPPWMVKKYPDIMRTRRNRVRHLYGERENQCNSNLTFRRKVKEIDQELAKRYAHHPGLVMWHISNEMYGECHCELCQQNFRQWLKQKYSSIETLNEQYWSNFWSHTYSDWDEIESPAPHGETAVHGLALDYKRFYSDLSIDFLKQEIEVVKSFNPEIPVTSNMFHLNCGIDYHKLHKIIDIASWDSYPKWHCGKDKSTDWSQAISAAFQFDFCRSLKSQPFLLMESTPSTVNASDVCKLKRPRMHLLSAVQAVACGSDSVQYFQWRKSRGAYEKFHGAVVSHNGSAETRVFRDVCDVGHFLNQSSHLKNTVTKSEVALIFDYDSRMALLEQKSLKNKNKNFDEIALQHYEALMKNYVSVDIISQDWDYSSYKVVIAPVLYLFKEQTANKIREFVKKGGTVVMTYYSGLVNENDLVYLENPPAGLQDVFGVESEEVDSLCDDEDNIVNWNEKQYRAIDYCDLIKANQAKVLAKYGSDFYKGLPALTENAYGEGNAYYIAFHSDGEFLFDFYQELVKHNKIQRIVDIVHCQDVMIRERESEDNKYLFVMNFSTHERKLSLPGNYSSYRGKELHNHKLLLKGYEFAIVQKSNN